MVRAGETGGFLEIVLAQIATFRVREADLKGPVKGALVYIRSFWRCFRPASWPFS